MFRRDAPKNGDPVEIVNTRIKRPCTTRVQRLMTRRRRPHEIPSKPYAIYNYCRECRGWEGDGRGLSAEVLACPNTGCILWSVRAPKCSHSAIEAEMDPYPTSIPLCIHGSDYSAKNARYKRIGDFCGECQCLKPGDSRDPIRKCSSPQCWVYPWRTGKLDTDTYEPETLEDLERRVEAESRERGKTG